MHLIRILLLFILSNACVADDTQADNFWVDDTLEEMVTPIKKWVETQMHESDPAPQNQPSDNDLRQAIKQATTLYPGTVLSAQYINQQYKIKIISSQGVIDVITVDMEVEHESPHH